MQGQELRQSEGKWEILVPTGRMLPMGVQRGALESGKLTALQVSYAVHPSLAITTMAGWARSRDIATLDDPKVDVFTYDLGAELRASRWDAGHGIMLRPFAGAGTGGRSYNYRSLDVDATHNLAAYVSMGGEVGYRRIRLRLEARDYVTGFKPLTGGGDSDTRNDVVVMAGIGVKRR